MSGILETKTRIMDVIITQEGRRQLTSGKFVPEYASFTDGHTFYEKDVASGSADASHRLYFEAYSRQQDQIVLETDDSGLLVQYNGGATNVTSAGKIYSASYKTVNSPAGSYNKVIYSSNNEPFSSQFSNLSGSIFSSFSDQTFITTSYPYEPYTDFSLSTGSISFKFDNLVPFKNLQGTEVTVEAAEPVFLDKRLSHLPNFKFLSPVYVDSANRVKKLGDYPNLKSKNEYTYQDLMSDLKGKSAELAKKEKITVNFNQTSLQGNVFMQIFEGKKGNGTADPLFKKLDCIDFGEFKDPNDSANPYKRVFFVGKVYFDKNDTPTYINLFTIIAE
jgi:hypothetical protein